MKQTKNTHIIPTDKPSKLYLGSKNNICITDIAMKSGNKQNIYITDNSKIREGDWVNEFILGICQQPIKVTKDDLDRCLLNFKNGSCKKIILTTDPYLTKDGVQAIDDEFLEWFVKNSSCERVEVENEFVDLSDLGYYGTYSKYKIIIPKEEPKQETLEEEFEKIDNTLIRYSTEESEYWYHYKVGVLDGLKWQAERMYSEEEVLEQLNLLHAMKNSTVDTYTDDEDYITNKWFEQFKKK